MKEFDFKHNPDGTITALRLKNHKYVELLTFSIEDIPSLLADVCRRLPPEVRRYMEQVRGDKMSEGRILPYMIGKFIDEDIHTIHVLEGKTYFLLAEFSMSEKQQVIDRIKSDYPLIAEKLQNDKGGTL